jgi:hypothetical protein
MYLNKGAKQPKVTAAHLITGSILGLTMGVAWTGGASAAPQTLDCVLTNPGNQVSGQSIVVTFDEIGKTMKAQRRTESYSFTDVSISNISPFMKSALMTHRSNAAMFSRIVHSSPAPPAT